MKDNKTFQNDAARRASPRSFFFLGGGGAFRRHPSPPTPNFSFSSDFGHTIFENIDAAFDAHVPPAGGLQSTSSYIPTTLAVKIVITHHD